MYTPEVVIIAAMDSKRGIGKDNKIPWKIKEDLQHFRATTLGHPIIMGMNTWVSLPATMQPLPERTNIVITRSENFEFPGVEVAHSIEKAIEMASKLDPDRIFIMGGGQIYQHALHLADRLDLTLVEGDYGCNVFFPEYGRLFNRVLSLTEGVSNKPPHKFVELSK